MENKLKQKNPTLHRYLFTVTTFSKLLALSMFIIFPIIGFYLGIQYQKNLAINNLVVSEVQKIAQTTITPIPNTTWRTYTNKEYNFYINYPYNWKVQENNPSQGPYQAIYIQGPRSEIVFRLPQNPDSSDVKVKVVKTEQINFGDQPTIFKYFHTTNTGELGAYSWNKLRQPFNLITFNLGKNISTQNKDLTTIKQILASYKSLK